MSYLPLIPTVLISEALKCERDFKLNSSRTEMEATFNLLRSGGVQPKAALPNNQTTAKESFNPWQCAVTRISQAQASDRLGQITSVRPWTESQWNLWRGQSQQIQKAEEFLEAIKKAGK